MNRPDIRGMVRRSIRGALGLAETAPVAGDDLRTMYARRIGVPVKKAQLVDRRDVWHVVENRADRRRRGRRDPLTPAELAQHPQPTYRKGK